MIHYVYILECENDSFYIGYTLDIERRYREHCEGSAKCKYTRSFPPKRIAVCWAIDTDKSTILQIEYALKQLPKTAKQALVASPHLFSQHTDLNYVVVS